MPYNTAGIGHADTDTSAEAAVAIAPRAGTLRAKVLTCLRDATGPKSADEIAEIVGADRLAIRPRMTELRKAGHIQDSGQRGKTREKKSCILWELTEERA